MATGVGLYAAALDHDVAQSRVARPKHSRAQPLANPKGGPTATEHADGQGGLMQPERVGYPLPVMPGVCRVGSAPASGWPGRREWLGLGCA